MSGRTILQSFAEHVDAHPNEVAFTVYGTGTSRTWREWDADARHFAAALVDSGCNPGDAVTILAANNEVWPIADVGALMAGAVSIGVYPTSADVQVHEILSDCNARVVVVDTAEQLDKVRAVRSGLPNLRTVLCLTDGSYDGWLARGANAQSRVGSDVQARIDDAAPDDIAIIVYTSGSTGVPKGARISHCYITASADSIAETLGLTATDSSLSFLPYCHASERVFGHYTRIRLGMSAMLVPNIRDVWEASRTFEPTVFGGLPRIYEKIYEATLQGASIASLIGVRVRIATSGGAALPREVAARLNEAGLSVLGAYGLTEHLCAVMHRPGDYSFDSVGSAMPGTTLRIGESGEVLIERSSLTFSGYQNKPAETRAAFTEDGKWLRTGDLGRIDEHGHLHITGREKELIALSGGKKIAPVPIERRLAESPWISQAVLFGENRKYITALLVLRAGKVEAWARERGIAHPYDALLDHPEILQHVQAEVDAANSALSRPEQIKRFALLPFELSPDQGELTPTLKIRRAFVEQKYQQQLDSLYA